jgi:hypothetical protein
MRCNGLPEVLSESPRHSDVCISLKTFMNIFSFIVIVFIVGVVLPKGLGEVVLLPYIKK